MIDQRADGRAWVKICGIRDPSDAEVATSAGADAVGVVVWPESERAVTPQEAAKVAAAAGETPVVAVTVDSTVAELAEIIDIAGVRGVQLHGNAAPDPAQVRAALPGITVISVIRIEPDAQVWPDLDARGGDAVLVDAAVAGREGGSGVALDWRTFDIEGGEARLILAGGLEPGNVADAIEIVRPFGVDVSSGVESSVGVKDPERIRAFLDAVRGAARYAPKGSA